MSTLTIGRAGLYPAIISTTDVYDLDGGKVRFVGDIIGSSLADAKAVRDQVAGLSELNEWEPVVPVTWSEDSTADGWYRVLDAKVTSPQAALVTNSYRFDVQLQRVANYQQPRLEVVSLGADRTGTPGGLTPIAWSAVSNNQVGYTGSITAVTRSGPGVLGTAGTARVYAPSGSPTMYYNASRYHTLAPASGYDMAATLKVGGYPVTGRQIPSVGNLNSWELNNGLVKLVGLGSTYWAKWYAPVRGTTSSWSAGTSVNLGWMSGGSFTALTDPVVLTVIRNSPEEVAVRFNFRGTPPVIVDVRLRRGAYYAELASDAYPLALRFSGVTACSTVGADDTIRATSDDGDGNRMMFLTGTAHSADLVNGRQECSASPSAMGLGWEVGGSTATVDAATVRKYYYAAVGETQRLVLP